MGDKSGISWTDATWNPIVGCSLVSPGCTHCYAMKQAARIVAMNPKSHYAGTVTDVKGTAVWTGKIELAPYEIFSLPLHWKRPRNIFVNSMGDLFHEDVPDQWLRYAFQIMTTCQRHRFQILTKRSRRMREYMSEHYAGSPLKNVWLGVSAEDQQRADERVPDLLATPAAIRFVSYEPALGPINFKPWLPGIDWIIFGGESGPRRRMPKIEWAEAVYDQTRAAHVALHIKQDSGARPGLAGRLSAKLWACKEFPK